MTPLPSLERELLLSTTGLEDALRGWSGEGAGAGSCLNFGRLTDGISGVVSPMDIREAVMVSGVGEVARTAEALVIL